MLERKVDALANKFVAAYPDRATGCLHHFKGINSV